MTNKQVISTNVRETSGIDKLLSFGDTHRATVVTGDGSIGSATGASESLAVSRAAKNANK